MRIGIDAKWYFSGPVSTRVVLQNLLPELFALYPEHEWVVFLDKKDKHLGFPLSQTNIDTQYVWAGNNMLSNLFILPRRLQRLKVDVMLFQTFPSLKRRVPSIAFIHDVLFREFPQFFSWKERLYFLPLAWLTRNRADRLIATTEFVAGDLLKYHYARSRSRIDLVPLGVNKLYAPAPFQDADQLARVKEKFSLPDRYILYVGRLNVRKNIENLLKALPLLHDTGTPLVIIGKEDWKAPDLQQLLLDPGIRKRIVMPGGMSNEELIATYAMAKVFCFPSFAEGFGLPPLEAMASGVPVIVAGATALPEVCADAAIYIDPSQPESIANALDQLLSDEELYNRKKRSGLERSARYTWNRTARATMQSIEKAFKNP
ncbi:MAG TPA: glycosyltransferase family 1 protein [Puia sp.]|nr:glycosyltransferase family 1 protein [Puia sp.]